MSCSPLHAKQGCRQVSVLEKGAGRAAEGRRAFSAAAFIAWFAGDELQVGRMGLARLGRGFAFSGKTCKKQCFLSLFIPACSKTWQAVAAVCA